MDHDELRKEIQRLQQKLATLDPETKEYSIVKEQLITLAKLEMDFNESCDKQLERQNEFELKKERMDREFALKEKELNNQRELDIRKMDDASEKSDREFDLKEKEIEQRHDVDVKKLDDAAEEAFNRRRAEKKQAWWDLAKLGASGLITAGLILVTKKSEEAVIFGQHVWSLIPKGPKVF